MQITLRGPVNSAGESADKVRMWTIQVPTPGQSDHVVETDVEGTEAEAKAAAKELAAQVKANPKKFLGEDTE